MSEKVKVNFTAKIKPVKPINDEFTLCKCYVLALGKNRNKSIILEAAVRDALPSLFNIPVVGHVFVDGEGNHRLGGHDMKLEKDADGKYKFRMLTVPYGTVPEDNEVAYEEVIEPNGETKTYLTANIILWTGRYPELKECVYNEDTWFGQSMEIKVKEIARGNMEENKDFMNINKFSFSGLCLLGKSDDENFHYEPCFPEAKVKPVEFESDESFALEFETMKAELAKCFTLKTEAAKTGKVSINADNTVKFYQETTVKPVINAVTQNSASSLSFAATYAARRDAICNALQGFTVSNDLIQTHCYLADFDDKYIYVERYLSTKDNLQSSFSKGRMTYEIHADEKASIHESSYTPMLVKWLTVGESMELDKQRDELATLTAYKVNQETIEKERQFNAVIEEFSDLAEDDAFIMLTEKYRNFTATEFDAAKFTTECYAIRGMNIEPRSVLKIPISETKPKNSKYGDFFDKHLEK